MGIRWENNLDLAHLITTVERVAPRALLDGGEVIKSDAVDKVPKETTHLAETAAVTPHGVDRVAITFDGPYARYQHERMDLHHDHGGQAKYLEAALSEKAEEAFAEVANVIRRAL